MSAYDGGGREFDYSAAWHRMVGYLEGSHGGLGMNDYLCEVCGDWIEVDPEAETAGPPICWDCPDDPLASEVVAWWYCTDDVERARLRASITAERESRQEQLAVRLRAELQAAR